MEPTRTLICSGRVSMLAVLGWFHVAGGWHFIGDFALGERVSDNPLINLTQLPMAGLWQALPSRGLALARIAERTWHLYRMRD